MGLGWDGWLAHAMARRCFVGFASIKMIQILDGLFRNLDSVKCI